MASGDRFWVVLVALLGLKVLAIGDFRHVLDLERDHFPFDMMVKLVPEVNAYKHPRRH